MAMARAWHSVSLGVVERELETSAQHGLEGRDARARQAAYGPNEIQTARGPSVLAMLAGQFQDFMVLVLLGATAVSAVLGEYRDVVAILAIVMMNALLGFVQEFRAERALAALRKLAAPHALVLREGRAVRVDAAELVPGDIILLAQGDRVPADARLVQCHRVEADESALTGESRPARKDAGAIMRESAPVAERRNMLYAGTVITRGRGTAIVVSTGMETQIGTIAGMISGTSEGMTPLQRRLAQLGRWIVLGCLLICATVAALGVARGESVHSMFMAGVSLAVAAIPEGLPAIVTVSLALGVQRMSARRAIVRRLSAVETLGCATVICADKTGTLTANEMTVVAVDLIQRELVVTGSGYAPDGEFREAAAGGDDAASGRCIDDPASDPDLLALRELLLAAALCNDARLTREEEVGAGAATSRRRRVWSVVGDPTEGALLCMAEKGGLGIRRQVRAFSRVAEIPFEPERRMMAVVCQGPEGMFTFVKGAPQVVLELCESYYVGPEKMERNPGLDRKVFARNSAMARRSMRVLALACARGNLIEERVDGENHADGGGQGNVTLHVSPRLTFLGLVGMMDPPRPEAARSVERARRAGIRTIMITGDHAETARAVAMQIGLIGIGPKEAGAPNDGARLDRADQADQGDRVYRVVTGEQLDTASDHEAARMTDTAVVFARVAPAHKLRIVRALRERGHIVAMTGDGVNDAPAIREADIGISMGLKGTDVAREASSMVLGDDDYATIIAAIEEGRSIYDNIRKFIRYLLASNVGEVAAMLLTAAAGLPLPLTPIQLLWMNLMTDGLPAMALAADPTDPDAMSRPPRSPSEGVFARGLGLKILAQGMFIGICTIACYILAGLALGHDLATARTMAFCTLVMSQLIYVFHCRSERYSASEVGLASNGFLVAAVAVSAGLQVAGVQLAAGQAFLGTRPLSLIDWALVLFLSGWSVALTAIARMGRRAMRRRFHAFRVRNPKKSG